MYISILPRFARKFLIRSGGLKLKRASLNHHLCSTDCLYLFIGTFFGLAAAGAYKLLVIFWIVQVYPALIYYLSVVFHCS